MLEEFASIIAMQPQYFSKRKSEEDDVEFILPRQNKRRETQEAPIPLPILTPTPLTLSTNEKTNGCNLKNCDLCLHGAMILERYETLGKQWKQRLAISFIAIRKAKGNEWLSLAEDVYPFFRSHWSILFPADQLQLRSNERLWQKKIQDSLNHNSLFESGIKHFGVKGYWRMIYKYDDISDYVTKTQVEQTEKDQLEAVSHHVGDQLYQVPVTAQRASLQPPAFQPTSKSSFFPSASTASSLTIGGRTASPSSSLAHLLAPLSTKNEPVNLPEISSSSSSSASSTLPSSSSSSTSFLVLSSASSSSFSSGVSASSSSSPSSSFISDSTTSSASVPTMPTTVWKHSVPADNCLAKDFTDHFLVRFGIRPQQDMTLAKSTQQLQKLSFPSNDRAMDTSNKK